MSTTHSTVICHQGHGVPNYSRRQPSSPVTRSSSAGARAGFSIRVVLVRRGYVTKCIKNIVIHSSVYASEQAIMHHTALSALEISRSRPYKIGHKPHINRVHEVLHYIVWSQSD